MKLKEMKALFQKHDGEFLKYERVAVKSSNSSDLHAFLLLDQLCPNKRGMDIVAAAEHDEIYLRPDPQKLAKVVTEDQIIDLIRCGVRLDPDNGLCMFV